MDKIIIDKITQYTKSQSRNKIIFHNYDYFGFECVNIGLRISESIYNFKESGRITMRIASDLNEILNVSLCYNESLGSYLSIENIGILLEPALKIDFARLLDSYSQNNVLFVKWDGEIDTENIYFLSKENGIKININHLSHIVL